MSVSVARSIECGTGVLRDAVYQRALRDVGVGVGRVRPIERDDLITNRSIVRSLHGGRRQRAVSDKCERGESGERDDRESLGWLTKRNITGRHVREHESLGWVSSPFRGGKHQDRRCVSGPRQTQPAGGDGCVPR